MTRYSVSASAIIPAAPQKVYGILADYRRHHPRIVPPQYFRDIEVLEGGFGAGTRTRFQAHVLGTIQEVRHVVTEPVPGRVLVESDVDKASTTTFKVEPSGTDAATLLTITTDLAGRDGLAGMVERWLTSLMLRRIYRKELALITEYAPTADL